MFANEPSDRLQLIADSVLQLSDFYINNPDGETPWPLKYCQTAYRNYYLPLNIIRCEKVIERGQQVGFFADLTHFVDWGCGPGTASLALAANENLKRQIKEQLLFDHSSAVFKAFADLQSQLIRPQVTTHIELNKYSHHKNACLVFSYSLTEVETLPYGWNEFEALMILEPSTSQDGRKLMELRKKLMDADFSIWAPCTHTQDFPLLTQSKHDWCHDRAVVNSPEWFTELEQLLPMKNRTVTTSYLLARKRKAPDVLKTKGRLTGDSLNEKGKTRQLICRNDQREFLTWMHKTIEPQVLPRGKLIDLDFDIEVKSNELRLKAPLA
jgi:hypothetical protein